MVIPRETRDPYCDLIKTFHKQRRSFTEPVLSVSEVSRMTLCCFFLDTGHIVAATLIFNYRLFLFLF
jgi:hypothetical protein